jgi:hypothetical protein
LLLITQSMLHDFNHKGLMYLLVRPNQLTTLYFHCNYDDNDDQVYIFVINFNGDDPLRGLALG